MVKIKFLVLVVYFSYNFAFPSKYCKICPDHTLCRYVVPGPSPQCVGYDTNALLSEDDRNAVLDKINERRNFIAIGRSRLFPEAANMKKLVWSEELATFAQRWVDQCDQSLRPDKKDKCRDLDNVEVGQSIATITGSSSYNVKSFVEMWYMESMDYTGSVTYYNQSRDHKTNYFTQLIWADTERVGCGKAKFFVKNIKPVVVNRLVCNFAPKANIHERPVYTIGYAATQCGNGMSPDVTFPGLCSRRLKQKGTLPSTNPPASSTSFLRIRNLFTNDSARQEIDPIYNNLKQMKKDLNLIGNHSNENPMRVLNVNNSYDAVKRSYPFKNEEIWNNQRLNNSTYYNRDYSQKREKGHSRVYHGHNHRNEFDYLHPETLNQDSRRYDYPTTSIHANIEQDYRKHNIDHQCTRKSERKLMTLYENSECAPCRQKMNKCTRGQNNNCRQNDCQMTTHRCDDQEFKTTTQPYSREFCVCNSLSTANQPNSYRCAHNSNCDCVNVNCPTKPCGHMLRTLRDTPDEKFEKQSDFQYYDVLSDIVQQSTRRSILKDSLSDIVSDENPWLPNNKHLKSLDRRKQLNRKYSERKRRVAEEDENFKPFWQMDEYVNKNQPQLKSIRFTTLPNKNNPKNKRTRKRPKTTMKTESITVVYKERSNNGKRITEKYLSFDELMYLRKHNNNSEDLDGRRLNENIQILRESNTSATVSETTEVTQEYTFNTPFNRLKYCTRKLTCTWTAVSLTDSAGSIIPGGGGIAIGGSRTPPGYVEGCTRTSTCTRDYMNRNKMATLPIETLSPEPEPGDDEDYCERRSLNRRSNNNSNQVNQTNYFFEEVSKLNKSLLESFNNCICYDKNLRSKRQNYIYNNDSMSRYYTNLKRESKNHVEHETNLLSYGDLYYYVVRKIIEMWKIAKSSYSPEKCLCNGVNKITYCNLFLVICLLYFIIFL